MADSEREKRPAGSATQARPGLSRRAFALWAEQMVTFGRYWTIFGGLLSLVRSPYVHVSLVLTLACHFGLPTGISPPEIAIAVVPNLLGFTVGTIAIILAFSSARIFKTLAEDGADTSFFMRMISNLVHYVLIQSLALVSGVIGRSIKVAWMDDVVLFLLFYAVLSTLSSALQLFQTAELYNSYASRPDGEGQ